MKQVYRIVLTWIIFIVIGAQVVQAKDIFTPKQEDRIREVMRDMLINQPEVLQEAIFALQKKQQQQQQDQLQGYLDKNAEKLYRDPGSPYIGPKNPKLTIVNFMDYNCPYCKILDPLLIQILEKYPTVGLVIKPLSFKGKSSTETAELALSAWAKETEDQKDTSNLQLSVQNIKSEPFFKLHEALMAFKGHHTTASIEKSEKRAGYNFSLAKLNEPNKLVLQAKKVLAANMQFARELGINGTPTTLIGSQMVVGAVPYDALEKTLEQELKKVNSSNISKNTNK